MATEISWDEATKSGMFVELKEDTLKVLVITDWKFEKRGADAKIAPGEIEFKAKVVEEDGQASSGKLFTTTSKRLKTKLRPILEGKESSGTVKLSLLKVGERFDTQYSVKELK